MLHAKQYIYLLINFFFIYTTSLSRIKGGRCGVFKNFEECSFSPPIEMTNRFFFQNIYYKIF